jgi:plastocyanin
VYDEAEDFLDKLADADKVWLADHGNPLQAELTLAGSPPAASHQENKTEIRLQDNRLDPPKVTVLAGTTVQWINLGQHGHTITSDQGLWNSAQLSPGGVYSRPFERPGIYS